MIAVILTIPPSDTRTITWWKQHAARLLDQHLAAIRRRRHGSTQVEIRHGDPSIIQAACDSRPA